MVGSIAVIVVILASVAYFYLKCSPLTSFVMLIAALLSIIVAFSYYEPLAAILLGKGWLTPWAMSISFLALFLITHIIITVISGYVVGANIDFGNWTAKIVSIVSGLIFGFLAAGMLLITLAMAPLPQKITYQRFDEQKPLTSAEINNAKKALLNVDETVAGIFGWISKGSLNSKRSFAVYHADFIDQLHLSHVTTVLPADTPRSKKKNGHRITTVAGKDAIVIHKQRGVRLLENGQTVIRMGISGKKITEGGAADESGTASFTLSQVRLICKNKSNANTTMGTAKVIYPKEYLLRKSAKTIDDLKEAIVFARTDFVSESSYGRVAWIDLSFDVPKSMKPVLLEFKQNAVVAMPLKQKTSQPETQP